MKSPIPDYLAEVLEACSGDTSGANADYIPELARADPGRLGIALSTVDGTVYCAGDSDVEFTIQSISKPFVYALAIAGRGLDAVLEKIGVEPSGEAFNEISLEEGTGRPRNPMVNVGAIAAHTLAGDPEAGPQQRFEAVTAGLSAFAGRELSVDERVFRSEMDTAHRNLSLAHMLRSYGIITEDATGVVRGYSRQCALLVTARDLALMAGTLANGGVQPVTGERVVDRYVVRHVLGVMTTCGMYDATGDWMTSVGIPAKSGVAGGVIGALPGQVGMAAFSPRLDSHGHSVRGVRICERLSRDMGLHLMEVAAPARSAMRSSRAQESPGHEPVRVYELQGAIQFAGAERVLRSIAGFPTGPARVAFDFTRVYSVNDVARRMLLEAVRRLTLDGHTVTLVDPESVLPEPVPGDVPWPEVVDSLPRGRGPDAADGE